MGKTNKKTQFLYIILTAFFAVFIFSFSINQTNSSELEYLEIFKSANTPQEKDIILNKSFEEQDGLIFKFNVKAIGTNFVFDKVGVKIKSADTNTSNSFFKQSCGINSFTLDSDEWSGSSNVAVGNNGFYVYFNPDDTQGAGGAIILKNSTMNFNLKANSFFNSLKNNPAETSKLNGCKFVAEISANDFGLISTSTIHDNGGEDAASHAVSSVMTTVEFNAPHINWDKNFSQELENVFPYPTVEIAKYKIINKNPQATNLAIDNMAFIFDTDLSPYTNRTIGFYYEDGSGMQTVLQTKLNINNASYSNKYKKYYWKIYPKEKDFKDIKINGQGFLSIVINAKDAKDGNKFCTKIKDAKHIKWHDGWSYFAFPNNKIVPQENVDLDEKCLTFQKPKIESQVNNRYVRRRRK